MSYVRRILRPK